jgi:integrase
MARKVSFSAFESRSARLNKFAIRRRPYSGPSLARGILLMYRRNKTNGTWVLKVSDGHGAYWTKAFALADDFEEADGKAVLTFHQAQDQAKKLARGDGDSAGAVPITVEVALANYRLDLIAGAANPYNADWPLLHLVSTLKSRPVALVTSDEWRKWRDGLLDTMARSTISRLCACLRAALNLAARQDKRIKNTSDWEIGLAGLPNASNARNVILDDPTVSAFVAAANEIEGSFGLFADVQAGTGARPSQSMRLRVEDLRDHPTRPSLWMPKSGKGGKRSRVERKLENYSVSITPQLAARLKAAAKGRPSHERLLLQSDGSPWGPNPGAQYHREVKSVVTAIGLDPTVVTMYALRHSSIVRMLLKSVPTSLVADRHNTSENMIRRHYAKYISEHSDDVSRRALLHHAPPAGENVVALAG